MVYVCDTLLQFLLLPCRAVGQDAVSVYDGTFTWETADESFLKKYEMDHFKLCNHFFCYVLYCYQMQMVSSIFITDVAVVSALISG